jgi:hypothetical protein
MTRHAERVAMLHTLAVLAGCSVRLTCLPDSRQPDVVCTDIARKLLFIGEGKDSEHPTDRETQARLLRYFQWLRNQHALVAICFGRRGDADAWRALLHMLAEECDIRVSREGADELGPGYIVAWVLLTGRSAAAA